MIFDCFTFFNEVDLLEIRLNELDRVVDRFVIVEACHTFQGKWRGFTFSAIREQFEEFWSKLTYVPVTETLPLDPWKAEYYVRNQIMRGLTRAEPDDIVLISDVDEIPNPYLVKDLELVKSERVLFDLREFYYCLDWEVLERINWIRPVATRAEDLISSKITPALLRKTGELPEYARVPDAGWHFSCLGDELALQTKFDSFAHVELKEKNFTSEYLKECIAAGRDFMGRFQCRPVKVDDTYPMYLQFNISKFKHLLRP